MRVRLLVALCAWLWAALLSGQSLPAGYHVRDLGVYPDRLTPSPGFAPRALSDRGVLVGWAYSSSHRHAFSLKHGVMVDLGLLPGAPPFLQADAYAINRRGKIVGQAQSPDDLTFHPALFENGVVIDLGVPAPIRQDSVAQAINDAGQIAGATWYPNAEIHAFLYTDGTMTDLGTLTGGRSSGARGMNNLGDVVGHADLTTPLGQHAIHAFLYNAGSMTDLGTLPLGSQFSSAAAINDAGQVVGVSASSTPYRAFLYCNGTMTDLGTLGGPTSAATAINQDGVVVGSADVTASVGHGFVWSEGVMHDLNEMIRPFPGLELTNALAINNRGQILAQGMLSGQLHSFVLYPICELDD